MAPLKKNEKIMFGLIGVSVILFLIMDPYYFIWKDPPVPEQEAPAGEVQSSEEKSDDEDVPIIRKAAKIRNIKKKEYKGWGRDPFLQLKRSVDLTESLGDLKLTGVSVSGDDRFALINSRIVREGDKVNGMLVSRIYSNKVIMNLNGQNFTLNWGN